ncbi:hypothetical protein FJT64_020830 [Amphibalanus amphitrite]|uniref:Uncharacterized protein n=1 Tax=Amphibalanus amphitrite TaxID=1232801 RepID=A0A6A4X0D6_AMPAM|nr:hypothetical protein FJT64_020830 [Amphibalanus amphitrite]
MTCKLQRRSTNICLAVVHDPQILTIVAQLFPTPLCPSDPPNPSSPPGSVSAPYPLPGACSASASSASLQGLSGLSGPLQVNTALAGRPPLAHQTAAAAAAADRDHRLMESLRVSAATGGGGYPQYQLVSPPGAGPAGPPLHHVVHMPPPAGRAPRGASADKR